MVWGYCMGKIPIISHQPVSKTSCGARGGWELPKAAEQPAKRAVFLAPVRPPVPSLEGNFPWGVTFALAPGLQVVNEGGVGGRGDTSSRCCSSHLSSMLTAGT